MQCPACKRKVQTSDGECAACAVDLRWSVVAPDGQLHGPYTVAELQGYAALGHIQPGSWVQNRYGDVRKLDDLDGAAEPVAPATPTRSDASWGIRRGVGTIVAIMAVSCLAIGPIIWIFIGVPALNRSHEAARRVGCLRDASMLAAALRAYAAAHDGQLPGADTWRAAVKPYLPPGKCPACGKVQTPGAGYEMNPALGGEIAWEIGDQPLIYDEGWMSGRPGPHGGNYTVAFVDGTAVWMPPERR